MFNKIFTTQKIGLSLFVVLLLISTVTISTVAISESATPPQSKADKLRMIHAYCQFRCFEAYRACREKASTKFMVSTLKGGKPGLKAPEKCNEITRKCPARCRAMRTPSDLRH